MKSHLLATLLLCAPALTFRPLTVTAAERIILVAGGTNSADHIPATTAGLGLPFGVDFDGLGNLFLVEMTGHRVRKIDSRGLITTIAGTGEKGDAGDGSPALQAQFNGMHNLAAAPNGDLFLADTWNNRVRKIDAKTGIISTVAGTGQKGFSGDGGPASKAEFGGIYCASLDPQGRYLYLADLDNRRIRAVDLQTGLVETVAGNGAKGIPQDGASATNSPLIDPRAVAADERGNIYVLERSGHALRVVDRSGKIRTVAGTGQKGATGDGGDALSARLSGPKHLCLDLDGNVILADTDNHVIRKVLIREKKIIRIAGSGTKGTNGVGGAPLEVELNQPHGVAVHRDGTLYIADSHNNRVLKIVR